MIVGIECVPPPAVRKRDKALPLIQTQLLARLLKRQGVRRTIALPQHVTLGRTKIAAAAKPTLSMTSPQSVTLAKIKPITKNIPLMGIGQSVDLATPGHNPIIEADFINNAYKLNGVADTIANVITDQSPSLITSSGMFLLAGAPIADMAGVLATQMLGFNWTIILEVQVHYADMYVTSNFTTLFNVGTDNAEPPFGYTNAAYAELEGEWFLEDENNDISPTGGPGGGSGEPVERFAEEFENALTDGIHKIACTRNNNHVAISVDGNPVQSDSGPLPFSMNPGTPQYHMFGGFQGSPSSTIGKLSLYIRSLTVYDSLNDSLLPALSDPTTFSIAPAGKLINHIANFATVASATSTTSITLNLPDNNYAVGDLLLAITTIGSGKSPVWPSGWDALGGGFAATRVADGTETNPTVTWTGSSSEVGLILSFKGNSSSPIGATNTNQSESGSTATVSAITTTADRSLVVGVIMSGGTQNVTTPSGFFQNYTRGPNISPNYSFKLVLAPVTGSGVASPSLSASINTTARWRAALIEIKGA